MNNAFHNLEPGDICVNNMAVNNESGNTNRISSGNIMLFLRYSEQWEPMKDGNTGAADVIFNGELCTVWSACRLEFIEGNDYA